ncbi:uncharacterized protein LOC128551527 [Mercenaria mercenaria]|uniref:uncharacterized protein LOC128551527 n=1 Tax=Mercenaria mercenaria TaxID=6596 RepID=UPI00234E7193|nr:uncharacterized protein LOC128551527 [Mercenaria mercenaria]
MPLKTMHPLSLLRKTRSPLAMRWKRNFSAVKATRSPPTLKAPISQSPAMVPLDSHTDCNEPENKAHTFIIEKDQEPLVMRWIRISSAVKASRSPPVQKAPISKSPAIVAL